MRLSYDGVPDAGSSGSSDLACIPTRSIPTGRIGDDYDYPKLHWSD